MKEGKQVAVHYTAKGSEESAEEVDRIGREGLKTGEGTVTHIDRAAKALTAKPAAGTKDTYHLTDRAAQDTGKDVAAGAEKAGHVTVYYTEEASHNVAHFLKWAI